MLGVALGLASSLAWGVSDFLGGLQTRRLSALVVLLVTQPIGLVAVLLLALLAGGDPLDGGELVAGLAAGTVGVLALGSFYHAMALGSIGVVSMIAALGVIVPVVGGLLQGERPATLQLAGSAIAIAGILAVSREPDPEWRAASRAAVGFAALAGIGFGAFFLLLDASAGERPTWTIVAVRVGGVTALLAAAAVRRPTLAIGRGSVPALVVIGLCDVLANTLFAVATNHGLLALVAVAGSLYPLVTLVLARVVLGERLAPSQRAGAAATVAGIAAIAAGS